MDLQTEFEQAQLDAKHLPERPDNMTLLQLYGLFKQATLGDAATERPGISDPVGSAKWDAWNALRGTSNEMAMRRYVELIRELKS